MFFASLIFSRFSNTKMITLHKVIITSIAAEFDKKMCRLQLIPIIPPYIIIIIYKYQTFLRNHQIPLETLMKFSKKHSTLSLSRQLCAPRNTLRTFYLRLNILQRLEFVMIHLYTCHDDSTGSQHRHVAREETRRTVFESRLYVDFSPSCERSKFRAARALFALQRLAPLTSHTSGRRARLKSGSSHIKRFRRSLISPCGRVVATWGKLHSKAETATLPVTVQSSRHVIGEFCGGNMDRLSL